jgi:hypothetical protein
MPFPAGCEYYTQQQFQNIAQEVMCVLTLLFNRQINRVKSITSPYHGQHKLLLNFSTDVVARHAPFRRVMKFHSKPTLITRVKASKCTFLRGFKDR